MWDASAVSKLTNDNIIRGYSLRLQVIRTEFLRVEDDDVGTESQPIT